MKNIQHKKERNIQWALVQLSRLNLLVIIILLLGTGITTFLLLRENKPLFVIHSSPGSEEKPILLGTVAKDYFNKQTTLQELGEGMEEDYIRYGHALITETYKYIGPEVKDPKMVYAGNNLACKSCHLDAGTKKFAAPYIGIWGRFPQYRGRENKIGTLEERINGCMERSMNGRKLPQDSKEMKAMITYMKWLSKDVPVGEVIEEKGFVKIQVPDRSADLEHGKQVFTSRCAVCHGKDGQGKRKGIPGDTDGYTYPPLWGPDSYNHGAGMHRVLTAARFIKANMPLGATYDRPILTDNEAFDVAAFINSFDRPIKANTGIDYPDLKKKPVDSPYPPYPDNFEAKQHKYGPFQPIIELRKQKSI